MDKKVNFKESIRKFFKLSAPIVGMLVQALYNAVDTFSWEWYMEQRASRP